MKSKVQLFGHAVHPMLIPFPIALYTATLVSFIVYAAGGSAFWFRAGFAANVAAVIMAIVAAIPGTIDLFSVVPDNSHAKKDGLIHMAFNSTSLVLFALNIWANSGQWDAPVPVTHFSIILPLLGFLVTLAAGYMGWTMVQTHHVGIILTPEMERCIIREEGKPPFRRAA